LRSREAAAANKAECDRAAERSITRAHGVAVIAGFNEPLAVTIRSAADDADVVGPHHHRADVRAAGAGTLFGPIAGQIESRISDAKDVSHINAAPCPAMAITAPQAGDLPMMQGTGLPMMMRGLAVMCRRGQSHERKRNRRDKHS
jgi:hypothetical protein